MIGRTPRRKQNVTLRKVFIRTQEKSFVPFLNLACKFFPINFSFCKNQHYYKSPLDVLKRPALPVSCLRNYLGPLDSGFTENSHFSHMPTGNSCFLLSFLQKGPGRIRCNNGHIEFFPSVPFADINPETTITVTNAVLSLFISLVLIYQESRGN